MLNLYIDVHNKIKILCIQKHSNKHSQTTKVLSFSGIATPGTASIRLASIYININICTNIFKQMYSYIIDLLLLNPHHNRK